MTGCCGNKSCTLDAMRANHGRVLKIVQAVNFVMFALETAAGIAVILNQSRWPARPLRRATANRQRPWCLCLT